jgi:dihydropyrimidinase
MEFDLVVKNGTIVTASEMAQADIGIIGERIAAIGTGLQGAQVIDAGGQLVRPGGVDSHCHIEQLRAGGGTDEESFITGSTAALAGGTTSVVTFAAQFKGAGLAAPMAEYRRRAAAGAMVDYAFHQIITDPSDRVIAEDLPAIVAGGGRQPARG